MDVRSQNFDTPSCENNSSGCLQDSKSKLEIAGNTTPFPPTEWEGFSIDMKCFALLINAEINVALRAGWTAIRPRKEMGGY
jgi:hypothetical protein